MKKEILNPASSQIAEILKRTKMQKKELAAYLFPLNKHAYYALRYVEQGKRELKESEINRIKALVGEYPLSVDVERTWVPINSKKTNWFGFRSDNYVVTIDNGITKVIDIFKSEVIIKENNLDCSDVKDFLNIINAKIKNYESYTRL